MTQPKLEVGKKYKIESSRKPITHELVEETDDQYIFNGVDQCEGWTISKDRLEDFIFTHIEEPMKEEVKPEVGNGKLYDLPKPADNPYIYLGSKYYLCSTKYDFASPHIFLSVHGTIVELTHLEIESITEHRELITKTAQAWLIYDPERDPTMGFLDQLFGMNVEDIWPQEQGGESKDFAEHQGFMCKKIELTVKELPDDQD